MCIEQIELLKKEFKLPIEVCEDCRGNGEITTFCGHDVNETCKTCFGKGYKRTDLNSRKIN